MTPSEWTRMQLEWVERRDWEENADFYLRETSSPLYALLNTYKVETFGLDRIPSSCRVLDLGGGIGFFSRQMVQWGHEPVTLDLAFRMLEHGGQAYGLDMRVQSRTLPLPFPDRCFDAVVANGVLHHCKAQHSLVESVHEIHRVLRPRGMLLIYDRNGALLGRTIHRLVVAGKSAIERYARFSSSSSTNEPDFGDADMQVVLDAGFCVLARRFVSTVPTFLAIVFTNTIEYAGSPRAAHVLRTWLYPLLSRVEEACPHRFWTVEQCVRLVKI